MTSSSPSLSHADRLTAMRGWMADEGIDAYLVSSADAHQSEDCPDHDRCLF